MNKKGLYLAISLVVLLGLFLGSLGCSAPASSPTATGQPTQSTPAPQPSQAKTITWNMQMGWPASYPILPEAAVLQAKMIEQASNGRLKIKVLPAGELVGALEIMDAVSAGTIEMGHIGSGFWVGKIPAAPIYLSVPFAPSIMGYMSWLYQGDGLKLWQELYDSYGYKIKVMPSLIIGSEMFGWFKKELKTAADLKGLKFRITGLGGKVMAKAGAEIVVVPTGEAYMALDRGIIDATKLSTPAIDLSAKMYEVADYYYYPGWHQPFTNCELQINKQAWDSLTPDLQAIVEASSSQAVVFGLTRSAYLDALALKEYEKLGVELRRLPDDVIKALQTANDQVLAEEAAKDAWFAKVIKSYDEFTQLYLPWHKMSEMPTK